MYKWLTISVIALVALVASYFGTTAILFNRSDSIAAPTVSFVKDRADIKTLSYPTTITGKIVGIADGDTVTILTSENDQYRIRLSGIDAPESKQEFGQKSKQNLSDMIFGKEVSIIATKLDKYGRTLGHIFVGSQDICLQQIKDGMAWHYKKYEDEQPEADRQTYADAETKARASKQGLWSQSNPMPPWVFRHPELAQ